MQNSLFGTDGIRGVAGEHPLTPEFITRIGRAMGAALPRGVAIIGRDTRASGTLIEHALAAGLMAAGFDTLHIGVLPTPGIAYLARQLGAACGIAISASHNPYQDNGIKVFGGDGFKIADALEEQIETLAQSGANFPVGAIGQARFDARAADAYENFLLDTPRRAPILRGKRIAVDCNHGATFAIAPRVLRALGADVITLNTEPDGVNINRTYDSLEPKVLREAVWHEHADWGVQFDGDGDRAVFVDERGNYIDGDFILAIFARALKTPRVISTVMANVGLEESLRAITVGLERTSVGDRWVTERMRADGALLGGEQSGHIVLFDGGHTTGDGLYTAIRLAEILARRNARLSELAACMQKYPQVLVNVRVPRKPPLNDFPRIREQVARSQTLLGENARILLRYSGTENLARVMVEGPNLELVRREAQVLSDIIRQVIV